MKNFIYLILFSFLLIIGCEQPVEVSDFESDNTHSFAKTSNVPGDYATIQEAIDAASDGDVINIAAGTYEELIKIYFRNNITLVGNDALITPPDDIINGDGVFNIDILESSNIVIKNLKFDGQIENKEYPVYCAIAFTHSSGEASYNNITGYGQGVVSWNPNPYQASMDLKISTNILNDCCSGFELQGNYDVVVENNKIKYKYNNSHSFDQYFPFWHGILMEGGTGLISKNHIKFEGGSPYLQNSFGVILMKRDPAPHLAGLMKDMHDVDVKQSLIKGTDLGIRVNSYDPLPAGEEWCVRGIRLLSNKFVQVNTEYEINNDCEEVIIEP